MGRSINSFTSWVGHAAETKQGYSETLPAFNCIGYKETIDYLKGRIPLNKMIDLIKVHTRQFSKRQMTWFKKIQNVTWKTI